MRHVPLSLAVALTLVAAARAADKPLVLGLWPGKPPGEVPAGEEKFGGKQGSRNLTNVSRPTLTVYRPAPDKNTGAAVVVAPGGGYRVLAWDHEGEAVAAWLNSLGVTAALLKYRVPQAGGASRDSASFAPLQDAQRAIGLVRSHAKEWGIDPKRVGMLGFSAGGHLTALAATNFDKRGYEPVDAADKESCRPDFAVLIYPGGVVNRGGDLNPGIRVTKETPQSFFAHANNDPVTPENSVKMYLALKRAGVPAELHVYSAGGHGFGMRQGPLPANTWPKRCEQWLRAQKIIPAADSPSNPGAPPKDGVRGPSP
jgi:acetyl esterase/lipase